MRIAWFRPTPPESSNPLDDIGGVIEALRASHAIDIFDASRAHDFVWMQARHAYDLCVYELDNTLGHQFIWPYLLHFPGVLALRTTTLHDSRVAALVREQRYEDYAEEMAFSGAPRPLRVSRRYLPRGTWPMLRAPLLSSRLAVVNDAGLVESLQRNYAGARVRYAPAGISRIRSVVAASPRGDSRPVTFGLVDLTRAAVAERAVRRARAMGAPVELRAETDVPRVLQEADVILALHWPSFGEPETAALLSMAASKPLIVAETYATAAWPAVDPQTWRPRGFASSEPPIVVSIDPRDEEHSLMLAMRRLASDASLRSELGRAAHAWWETHATVAHAVRAWSEILDEAALLEPPVRPTDWPPHLSADGTERARAMLHDLGASVDFLQ